MLAGIAKLWVLALALTLHIPSRLRFEYAWYGSSFNTTTLAKSDNPIIYKKKSISRKILNIEMSLSSLLRQSNSEALSLSQQTAQCLQKHASTGTFTIPIPFLAYQESTDTWFMYEKLFLSCLRTGDDKAAFNCLEKLIDRFGATNERVMGLRGIYQEAVAKDDTALERVLKEYNDVLDEDTVNIVGIPYTNFALNGLH